MTGRETAETVPPELDPYEPDFHLTPEDEAALGGEAGNPGLG